jgi:hypothetical protein
VIHALIDDYLAYNGFEGARAVLETGEQRPGMVALEHRVHFRGKRSPIQPCLLA